jgi:hypothetical protein
MSFKTLKIWIYYEIPKSFIILKLETLKPLMPHVACLKNLKNLKLQVLKTLEIFKSNRI